MWNRSTDCVHASSNYSVQTLDSQDFLVCCHLTCSLDDRLVRVFLISVHVHPCCRSVPSRLPLTRRSRWLPAHVPRVLLRPVRTSGHRVHLEIVPHIRRCVLRVSLCCVGSVCRIRTWYDMHDRLVG